MQTQLTNQLNDAGPVERQPERGPPGETAERVEGPGSRGVEEQTHALGGPAVVAAPLEMVRQLLSGTTGQSGGVIRSGRKGKIWRPNAGSRGARQGAE